MLNDLSGQGAWPAQAAALPAAELQIILDEWKDSARVLAEDVEALDGLDTTRTEHVVNRCSGMSRRVECSQLRGAATLNWRTQC
eukprot:12553375-Heterocapsa_arctica.AAC.1